MPFKNSNNPIIIVYHAGCLDGMASAWVIARALRVKSGGKNRHIKYIPYEHSKIAEDEDIIRNIITSDTIVYFVDVAPEEVFLSELMSANKNGERKLKEIHILDHHASSAKRLGDYSFEDSYHSQPYLNINIDITRNSATAMIWDIVFPYDTAPPVIKLIDKMDVSTFLETDDDFSAAAYIDMHSLNSISDAFKSLRSLEKLSFIEMVNKGTSIKEIQQVKIEELLKNVSYTNIQILPDTEPITIPIVNGNVRDFGRLVSGHLIELGKETGSNISFAWFKQVTGAITMSLRSDGNPDLTKVTEHLCESFGIKGGGHKNSAAVHFLSNVEFSKYIVIEPTDKINHNLAVKNITKD